MADIYFRRTRVIGGEYWKLIGVRNVEPEKRSGLSLDVQEYQAISGDIGTGSRSQAQALERIRNEMEAAGHTLHLDAEVKEKARCIVNNLLEGEDIPPEDLDAPDMSYWGERLSVEARLDKLYGRPYEYMKKPGIATQWSRWFHFGRFQVWSTFTIFYKVKNAPAAGLSYEIKHAGLAQNDAEFIRGHGNILKLIELLEQGVEKLKANPPQKVSDVTRVFHEVLRFAYQTEQEQGEG